MPNMVYMMTNSEAMNQVVAFTRGVNGILTFIGSYSTYGRGTGTREVSTATANDGVDPLASQGSLTLSCDGRFLLADAGNKKDRIGQQAQKDGVVLYRFT